MQHTTSLIKQINRQSRRHSHQPLHYTSPTNNNIDELTSSSLLGDLFAWQLLQQMQQTVASLPVLSLLALRGKLTESHHSSFRIPAHHFLFFSHANVMPGTSAALRKNGRDLQVSMTVFSFIDHDGSESALNTTLVAFLFFSGAAFSWPFYSSAAALPSLLC
jgi:hypothetical protein